MRWLLLKSELNSIKTQSIFNFEKKILDRQPIETMDTLNGFRSLIVFFIICSTTKGAPTAEHKIIETLNGKVRGLRQTTLLKNTEYYSFRGIPYAQTPTGELRFRVSFSMEMFSISDYFVSK